MRLRELLVDADIETTTGSPCASRLRDALVHEATRRADRGTGPALSAGSLQSASCARSWRRSSGWTCSIARASCARRWGHCLWRALPGSSAGPPRACLCRTVSSCSPIYLHMLLPRVGLKGVAPRGQSPPPHAALGGPLGSSACWLLGCCLRPLPRKAQEVAVQTRAAHTRPCTRTPVTAGQQPRGGLSVGR